MKKFIACISGLLIPAWCFAQAVEIHECDGRWTNLPCDKLAPLPANKKILTPEEAKARSQKESLLHRLRMKSIEANRKYDVDLDISSAEDLCNNSTTSLEICRREAERLDDKLDKKINTAALLKQKEEKLKEPAVAKVPNQTTVIIRERYPVYRRRYGDYGLNTPGNSTGQVIQGQQIQQNVIIQQPIAPPPPPPTPQSSGSSFRNIR